MSELKLLQELLRISLIHLQKFKIEFDFVVLDVKLKNYLLQYLETID